MSFTGKSYLVTGGSRGIGRAVALGLADRGAAVAVHYARNESAAADVVAEISARGAHAFSVRAISPILVPRRTSSATCRTA
jgi:NAD(P)-dependent dehydrogenase (short-subunit alcohol dehydrogenase family)